MPTELTLSVNGTKQVVSAAPETPLLFVLRNDLKLTGPRLGCGMAQCGACSVLLDGEEVRACITPVSEAVGKQVTTIEGLPAVWAGRTETGTGMSGYYAQAIAEELSVRPETVSLILGDTDKTPDGGYSAGFLSGMINVRKVAAYAYQALLGLAATQLGVSVSSLTVTDAIVSGGGKSISYGQLVQGQHLDLKIPVSGTLAKAGATEWVGVAGLDGLTVTGDP